MLAQGKAGAVSLVIDCLIVIQVTAVLARSDRLGAAPRNQLISFPARDNGHLGPYFQVLFADWQASRAFSPRKKGRQHSRKSGLSGSVRVIKSQNYAESDAAGHKFDTSPGGPRWLGLYNAR